MDNTIITNLYSPAIGKTVPILCHFLPTQGNNVGNVGNDVGNRFKDFITQGEFIIYSIIKENPQISATRIASNIKLAKRGVE